MAPDRPRVFVARTLPGDAVERLGAVAEVEVWPDEMPPPYDVLRERAADVEGLLTLLTDRVDAPLLEAAARLRVVANMAVGYDNIDLAAATARGVLVANTPGVLTETTADFAFALLMAAARRVCEGDRASRDGRWRTWSPTFLLGQDVGGATIGIVGMGAIGRAVARRARGFGMRVLYADVRPVEDLDGPAEYAALDDLLRASDFVTVHVPLSPETRHRFGSREFDLMKRSAVFVNTSRGPVVDEAALAEALRSGTIAGAGVDVTEVEPLPLDSALLALPNLVVTPHIASASVATRSRMAGMAADAVIAGLEGRVPATCLNPEALSRRRDNRSI